MKALNRGDLIYVDLGNHAYSCIQSGIRPCLVLAAYPNSMVASVCPLTTKLGKKYILVHVNVNPEDVNGFLEKPSLLLMEQITTIDRRRIISKTGHIPKESEVMVKVDQAIKKQFGVKEKI